MTAPRPRASDPGELMRRKGCRLTEPRRRILAHLSSAARHESAETIFRRLRRGFPRMGRATVFRTLKMLQECGLVSPVVGRDGTPRFEIDRGRPHHDHLVCMECGHIHEVRWPKLERIQQEACRRLGFTPRWHRHEVFGLCRDCSLKH